MWLHAVLVVVTAVVVMYVPALLQTKRPTSGQGWSAPGWRKVADVFRSQLESGLERGGAIAVYHEGELVLEFAGGYADYEAHYPWSKDTLGLTCSTAKAVAAVVMTVLVDRGLLNYTDPVAKYWPEFGQAGKEEITVEQLMSHQAGLAAIDVDYSAYDILYNPGKVAKILAAQPPNWEPGSKFGYHGITLGLYLDQIVRRVDTQHRDMASYFNEEIAVPYGIDFHFGLPLAENHRTARVVDEQLTLRSMISARRYWPIIKAYFTEPNSVTVRSITNPEEYVKDGVENNPTYRAIPNPSTHGFATAKGLAKLLGMVANGGRLAASETASDSASIDGKAAAQEPLLSDEALAMLQVSLTQGWDEVLRMDLTFGRGVMIRSSPTGSRMFGAPGAGGQMGFVDTDNKLSIVYITNYHSIYAIGDDPRYLALERTVYQCLNEVNKNR